MDGVFTFLSFRIIIKLMRQEVFDFLTNEKKSDVRFFLNKNNQRFFMINNPSYYDNTNENCIKIYDAETLNEVGELTYCFSGNHFYYESELDKLLVKQEAIKHSGIENYALMFFEEISFKTDCLCMSANFYPEDNYQKDKMEKFFFKLGYTTDISENKLEIFKSLVGYDISSINSLIKLKTNGYSYYIGLPRQNIDKNERTL